MALTDGILSAIVFHTGTAAAGSPIMGWDVAAQTPVRRADTAVVGHAVAGPAFIAATGDTVVTVAEGSAGFRLPTTSMTLALLRRCTDATARNARLVGSTSVTAGQLFALAATSTGANLEWRFGGSSSPNLISGAYTRTQAVEAIVGVAGVRGTALYYQGRALASLGTAVTRTAATATVSINDAFSSGAGENQEIYLVLILEQEWTPTQVLEWTVNPWSVFQAPGRRRVQLPTATTGSGPLLAGSRNRLVLA